MRKMLLSNQDGDGLSFKWLTSLNTGLSIEKAENICDGRGIGHASFYIADVYNDNAEGNADIDDLQLIIPDIIYCPVLVYNKSKDKFEPVGSFSNEGK